MTAQSQLYDITPLFTGSYLSSQMISNTMGMSSSDPELLPTAKSTAPKLRMTFCGLRLCFEYQLTSPE
jgi:hypothetical protein